MRFWREFFQLTDLPLQPIPLGLLRGLLGECSGQLSLFGLPFVPAQGDLLGRNLAKGVQHVAHGLRLHQALPGVLPVNVQQKFTQLLELGRGGRCSVDPGPVARLVVNRPAQQKAAVRFDPGLVQPVPHVHGNVEFSADIGFVGTFAHHGGFCPSAKYQLQGIDQDGFPRACFACQDRKAKLELQVQGVHNGKVFECEPPQGHGHSSPSFQRSFLRSVEK